MSTHVLRPWTDLVKLHPDVEAGALTEAVFAIDLGAIAATDPNAPVVNRDPEAFFRATYLTVDLQKLLDEVLASLSAKAGYNRVQKLRVPFGGGKSHTLASLFHAARKREARVAMTFDATREQVFKAFPAIANLADKSDGARVRIRIEGLSAAGFDPSWLRNAVDEPLDEADIERTTEK